MADCSEHGDGRSERLGVSLRAAMNGEDFLVLDVRLERLSGLCSDSVKSKCLHLRPPPRAALRRSLSLS